MTLFPTSRSRFERAIAHVKAFDAEWKRVVGPDAYEIITKPNSDWTQGATWAVRKTSGENTLALELGEFFYQLRASLDALIYQASIFFKCSLSASEKENLYFPCCKTPKSFEASTIHKIPFPKDLSDWLEALQPYKAANTTDPNMLEVIRIVALINTCAKIDRHRHLHVVAAFPTRIEVEYIATPPTITVTDIKRIRINFLESESPFLVFGLRGVDLSRENNIKLKTNLRLEVSVDQVPIAPSETFDLEVQKMLSVVDGIIRFFEDGFKQ